MQRRSTYLYIFERTTQRSLWAVVSFQWELKIGISHSVEERLSSVRSTTPGQVECIFAWRYFTLAAKGKKKRTNGETEWFYICARVTS